MLYLTTPFILIFLFSHSGKFYGFGQQTHDHDIKAHFTHSLQPFCDKLRLQLLHQASHFIVHHVGSGVKPLEDHADQPSQALRGRVLVGGAQAHL